MTVDDCILAYNAYRASGGRLSECDDPIVNAGAFLRGRGKAGAIAMVKTHCTGQFIDMPPFAGCFETLALLQTLTE